ncbi:MAG: SRPBCC family protein [Prolixibacteraceae bacterium]
MGTQKYVSDIKYIDHNQQVVYDYLSNFDNLAQYVNEGLLSTINEKVPQIRITDFESDSDSCRFKVAGVGDAEIRIVEREPSSTIKISSSGGLPIGVTFWIQLVAASPEQTKMRLTLHAEMNIMIKMMVNKKLEDGIDQVADMLAKLPYA